MEVLNIHGQYQHHDLAKLLELVAERPEGDAAIIECGCFKGRSTAHIANAIYPELLLAVDLWENNRTKFVFQKNMQEHTKWNYQLLQGDALSFLQNFAAPIKFCHLDDDHEYEYVVKELNAVVPKLISGGILCGHDYTADPGVAQAVHDTLPDVTGLEQVWWWRKP